MIKLSGRLKAIAGFVDKGETVADVGTDHGFLPLYLLDNGISPKVILTDVSPGSLDKARLSCIEHFDREFEKRMGSDFELRLGDGLEPILPGETETVIMAGMGGLLMSEIMGQDIDKTRTFGKFILQPRNNVGRLRKWLYLSGFYIAEETLVRERKRICEILKVIPAGTAERKNLKAADMEEDVMFEYPDMLVDEPNPLTEEYLRVHLEKEQAIRDRILKGSDRSRLRITENRMDRISGLYRRLMK